MRIERLFAMLMVGFTAAGCADMGDQEERNEAGPVEAAADEPPVEPVACTSTSQCAVNGCCGFAEGGDVPRCVESPSSTCDVPGTVTFNEEDDGGVYYVANGSSTLKDTCYCSSGTYRVKWCYSTLRQYWYTNGYC